MILASLVLPIEAPSRPDASHLLGWFYHLLRDSHPELHDRQMPPPFTLSVAGREGGYWLRITLLQELLYAELSPELYSLAGKQLRLGPMDVRVRAVLHEGHPWAGLTTYPRLFRDPIEKDYPFRFASPMFFRRKKTHYPLPEPKLVFGSLYERFSAYAPVAPPEELQERFEYITLRQVSLHTRSIEHESRGVGVVGKAVYHLLEASDEEARWLTVLWRFSFYAGIGAKTSLGFGQTRPLKVLSGVKNGDTDEAS